MKPINQLATNRLVQSSVSNEQPRNEKPDATLSGNDIDEIYRRMTRLYGHKFTSNYGECDDGTWLMALQGLSINDLTRGMTEIMNTPNEWPPSVPKFKQLCLGIKAETIKHRAEKLVIKSCGMFNFQRLTYEQCRCAIKEMLGQATKELMHENMEYSQKGMLETRLNQLRIEAINFSKKKTMGFQKTLGAPDRTEKAKAKNFIKNIKDKNELLPAQ